MSEKSNQKTELTPLEQIIAGYCVEVLGMNQAKLAAAMNVSNVGRISEAAMKIRAAVGLSTESAKERNLEKLDLIPYKSEHRCSSPPR